MATTGVMNGTKLRLYVDQAGGSTHTVIGTSLDVTLNFSHSVRETTNQDSAGHYSCLEGKRTKTISFNALHSEDGTNDFALWYATLDSETLRGFVTCKVASTTTGDSTYTYNGYITSISIASSGVEGNASFSGEVQVTGKGASGVVG